MIDAVGENVVVEVLEKANETSTTVLRADVQASKIRGRLISVGSEAKQKEPKLEAGKLVYFYKQPDFEFEGKRISIFKYVHIMGVLNEK